MPPFTRCYLAASTACTASAFVLNQNKFWPVLQLEWPLVIKRLQIWRPVTAFLFLGQFSIGYVLTLHFVWSYMGILEKLSYAEPWEFATMIAFGCVTIVAGNSLIFGSRGVRYVGHNLSCFLVYIWSRSHEGMD